MKKEKRRVKKKQEGCSLFTNCAHLSCLTFFIFLFSLFFCSCPNPYIREQWSGLYVLTVNFDSMGGSDVDSQTIYRGDRASKPDDPTLANYGFIGWYKNQTYTAAWDFLNDKVMSDTSLYARWDIDKFNVTFDSMGGSPVAPLIDVPWGSTITAPAIPTRDYHGFFAWYKEAALINEWDFSVDVVTNHTTLYARWVENTVVVVVDVEQILNETPIFGSFTISRSGAGGIDQKAIVKVNASDFDAGSIKWSTEGAGIYAGQYITGILAEFELDATDARYNSLGNHVLALEVKKSGKIYRVNIHFTIVE